jgi:hypothetical protein
MVAMSRSEAAGTDEADLWETPDGWPPGIRKMPIGSMDHFCENPKTGKIYWRGEPFVLKRRFEDFERRLAVVALVVAGVGSIAAAVQRGSLSAMSSGDGRDSAS